MAPLFRFGIPAVSVTAPRFRTLLAVLLAVGATVAHAGPAKRLFTLSAGVVVDAQGHVADVSWRETDPAAKLVADRVTDAVRHFEFNPATVDGVPTETHTSVLLQVEASEAPDGSLALRLVDATSGPVGKQTPPAYPRGQLRAGLSAVVTVHLTVDAQGTRIDALDFDGSERNLGRTGFEVVVRGAVKQWEIVPDRVGERIVPVTIAVPVRFCADTRFCDKHPVGPRREAPRAGETLLAASLRTQAQDVQL
jgi:hypothetical protein